MDSIGVILVHGVSGSYKDLLPLSDLFSQEKKYSVLNIELPNHSSDSDDIAFIADDFQNFIQKRINQFTQSIDKYIVIGHSTGGTILLSILNQLQKQPLLIIMLATPYKVDMAYIDRWGNSTQNNNTRMNMNSMAELIALINQTSRKKNAYKGNMTIFHAFDDELVPYSDSQKWGKKLPDSACKLIGIKNSSHHLIKANASYIFGNIEEEISRITRSKISYQSTKQLESIDTNLATHIENTPNIANNLIQSPSVQRALSKELDLSGVVDYFPSFANIEITTHCNFRCSFCAREHVDLKEQHMSLAEFETILSLLPETYKVRIVGLGEPLLHKQIADFIQCAKKHNKHIGIVTNAQLLTEQIGKELIQAGLDEITFSIDSTNQDIAEQIRRGSNISKIITNINKFLALDGSKNLRTAVFTAISKKSIPALEKTISDISKLDIQAIVVSDLNFEENSNNSVHSNLSEHEYETLKNAIAIAYKNGKPVINSRAIEEFGIEDRIRDFLIRTPEQIYEKSTRHKWCLSPWQTLPILVNGDVTVCDCQPNTRAGNIFKDPIDKIWNSCQYSHQRQDMQSEIPSSACSGCPRF